MTDTVPSGLAAATSAIVADALDALGLRDQAMDPEIAPLFSGARVVGRAYPVEVGVDTSQPESPYEGEMAALSSMKPGDIGVYAVDPTTRAAAWGELFSCAAIGRGVTGVVVDGCVRDARQISDIRFPVFARTASPLDTMRRARVMQHGHAVTCGGRRVATGDLIVGDDDGVVVVPAQNVAAVAEFVATKHRLEQSARSDLMSGMSIQDVWDKYRVF